MQKHHLPSPHTQATEVPQNTHRHDTSPSVRTESCRMRGTQGLNQGADECTERHLKVTSGTKGKRTSTNSSSTEFKINSTADGLHTSAHFAISSCVSLVLRREAARLQPMFRSAAPCAGPRSTASSSLFRQSRSDPRRRQRSNATAVSHSVFRTW